MRHRLSVFLLMVGLTLPIFLVATVRAGPVVVPIAGAHPPAGSLGLVPGEATRSLDPGSPARRSWTDIEGLDVHLGGTSLVTEILKAVAPPQPGDSGIGEPRPQTARTLPAASVGDDSLLTRSLRHEDRETVGDSIVVKAGLLFVLLVAGITAGGWVVAMRPAPVTGPEDDTSDLTAGDEAILESPGKKGIWVALDDVTLKALLDAQERSDLEEVTFLLARKKMYLVRNGTRVEVLGPDDVAVRICFRSGPNRGVEAWVQRDFVRRVRAMPRYDFSRFNTIFPAAVSRVRRPRWGVGSFFKGKAGFEFGR